MGPHLTPVRSGRCERPSEHADVQSALARPAPCRAARFCPFRASGASSGTKPKRWRSAAAWRGSVGLSGIAQNVPMSGTELARTVPRAASTSHVS